MASIVTKDLWAEENIIDSDSYFTEEDGPQEEEEKVALSHPDYHVTVRDATYQDQQTTDVQQTLTFSQNLVGPKMSSNRAQKVNSGRISGWQTHLETLTEEQWTT